MVGMAQPSPTFSVRPAIAADVPAIHHLIEFHAQRGRMILRGFDELYSDLRSFMVGLEKEQVIGCASVHLFWSDLAELKCVAVEEGRQRQGVGRAVVDACHRDLRRLGIKRAFTLTSAPEFFEHLGYHLVAKDSLPRFIWGECVRCPSFPVCNEEALVFDLAGN
jgi:amino-acid N-acetyltransferase